MKYDREEMRIKMRDALRALGLDLPDELPNWEVVVKNEDGKIVKRWRMGEGEKAEKYD